MYRPLRILIASISLALAVPAMAAEYVQDIERSFDAEPGVIVDLENLAGELTVVSTGGDQVEIMAHVVAGGRSESDARELAEMLNLTAGSRGGRIEIRAEYPTDEYRNYVYDPPWGGNTQSETTYLGRRVRVSSRGRGAELHVDFHISLPEGVALRAENHVGEITATGLASDLVLGTASGGIKVSDSAGRADLDTGSGHIDVTNHVGKVRADTGSGGIDLVNIEGDILADTGSGSITLERIRAQEIDVDTGSGGVRGDDVTGSLFADTGSGRVTIKHFMAGEIIEVDTGSGGVRIEGDLSAVQDLDIATGSGGVVLRTSHLPSWQLDIEVGSGGIRVDLPSLSNVDDDDDYFRADVGSAEGRARIDTGSGGVRISIEE